MYIVSDHKMYAMLADPQGMPQVLWEESYDRGSGRKVGTINQGSGTTPTLIGDEYLTITDNADGRINLLVYRRKPEPRWCRLCGYSQWYYFDSRRRRRRRQTISIGGKPAHVTKIHLVDRNV